MKCTTDSTILHLFTIIMWIIYLWRREFVAAHKTELIHQFTLIWTFFFFTSWECVLLWPQYLQLHTLTPLAFRVNVRGQHVKLIIFYLCLGTLTAHIPYSSFFPCADMIFFGCVREENPWCRARLHLFAYLSLLVQTLLSWFKRRPCFSEKSSQGFVHFSSPQSWIGASGWRNWTDSFFLCFSFYNQKGLVVADCL